MEKEFFKGQSGFLADYKKVVKDPAINEQQVIDEVLAQLDLPDDEEDFNYVLSGSQTKSGNAIKFPFKKELVAQDQEATISNEFIYVGEPYEVEYRDEEEL